MEKNTSMAEWTKKKYEEREIRWKRREYAGKIVAELRMRAQLFEWRGVETEVAKERGIRLQGGGGPSHKMSVCLPDGRRHLQEPSQCCRDPLPE